MHNNKNIWSFFITRARFTFVISIAVVLFGFLAISQIPRESDPEVDIPIASIVTIFPGASPVDVEELVTDPIESKLSSISGIDSLTSNSRNGVSQIIIEFNVNTDKKEVMQDVRDAVDEVATELPDEAEDTQVNEIAATDEPILRLSLGGDFPLHELQRFAEDIEESIERINGVSQVDIYGGQTDDIQVLVDKAKLAQFGISLPEVTQAIGRANSDIPLGAIETGDEAYTLRLAGRLNGVEDISGVPIRPVAGQVVTVSDVATVQRGYTEITSLSQIYKAGGDANTSPSVTIEVKKVSRGDITRISAAVKDRIAELVGTSLPDSLNIIYVQDLGQDIQDDLVSLSRNGMATVIIVFLVLMIFLGIREAVLASIAIPLAFLMTFAYLFYIGYTINFMTLFSLILTLGILVDSTIVINEGLNKNISKGLEPTQAALNTVKEYQWSLIAGTLTTVFAFIPMLLTSGIIGQYIKSIPVTVTGVLLSSLFVALAIITTLTAAIESKRQKKLLAGKGSAKSNTRLAVAWQTISNAPGRGIFDALRNKYVQYLDTQMLNKKGRRSLLVAVIILLIASFSLPARGALQVNMFPESDFPSFSISYELPIGSRLEDTQKQIERIEAMLYEDTNIASFVTTIGQGGEHNGSIFINLIDASERPTSVDIVESYRDRLVTFSPGKADITQAVFGPPSEAPVVVTIFGEDLSTLELLANDAKMILEDIPGTTNLGTSVRQTNGELVFRLNRQKAAQLGLSTSDVAFTLRNAIAGSEATEVNIDGDDVDVTVRYALSEEALEGGSRNETSIDLLRSLTISGPNGPVPVDDIAEIRLEHSFADIVHDDTERISKVTAFTKQGVSALDVFAEFSERQDELNLPNGYRLQIGGDNEDINQSFADMFRAMIIAIFMIAALLVLQFNSFKQSVIILVTIPLALIGVFPGLTLLNLPLSFPGIIGIVALVGIVVNNAIILIDTINQRKNAGMGHREAVIDAGKSRVEPIVLTTLTTVFGIMPLAVSDPVWSSLGFAIIFGLMFSTVLTLLVIPTLYHRFCAPKGE